MFNMFQPAPGPSRSWPETLLVAIFLLEGIASLYAASSCVARITGPGSQHSSHTSPVVSASLQCQGGAAVPLAAHKSLTAAQGSFSGVTLDDSCFRPGCLITLCGSAAVVLLDSTITGLSSDKHHSVLCATNSSRLSIVNTSMSSNTMRAVYGRDNASIVIKGSELRSNAVNSTNGGAIWMDDRASLELVNSIIALNWASKGDGAGLFISGSASAVINSSRILRNFCDALQGAAGGLGGGVAAIDNATVVITGNSVVQGNMADISGAGLYTAGRAVLHVSPDVLFGSNQVRGKAFGYDLVASGSSRVHLPPTEFSNATGDLLAGISKCSKGVVLDRSPCGAGEFTDSRTSGCVCCPERSYSFDTSGMCQPCPNNALCPGGDVVQSLPGFWRSSSLSAQVHKCPLHVTACAGKDVCQPAYQGPLCGACAPGHGHVLPLTCTKCMRSRVQLALYAVVACVTVFFIAVTMHFTYKDNVEGGTGLRPSDFIKVLVQHLQYLVIIGSVAVPWPKLIQGLFRASAVVFGVAAGQALSSDCWLAYYASRKHSRVPRAIQLQLVQFLAPVLVLLALFVLQLLWWGVRRCLAAATVGSTSKSCVQLQAVAKPPLLRECLRVMPLAALMVVYYAYPTLLRASLSFFACLHIDSPNLGTGVAVLAHVYGYSVLDIQQECFTGWHKRWTLGLGLPAVLVTCVIVPVGLLWLLKSRAKLDEQAFREHFGFLYRNYAPDRTWWEACWAVQTVLLSLIAAFHFRLEAYYSVLLLSSIFALSAALQGIFKPYMVHKLHSAHYASTACLFVTCLGALTMFPVDKPAESVAAAHAAVAVFVIVMNAVFVAYCIYAAVMASSGSLKALFVKLAALLTCGANMQQLPSHVVAVAETGGHPSGKNGPVKEHAGPMRTADSAGSLRGPSLTPKRIGWI
jgi:hypothetical protein